ncbi:hypothetical protein OG195_44360 (plasmid) [Streptomyces sp. NBC_01362]|nr:hypothetical protein [Streptomyces sp. NBC_01362]
MSESDPPRVNALAEAEAAMRLSSLMARYTKVDLLCRPGRR